MILAAVVAAATAASMPDLSYRVWTAEDGLAQDSVYAIEQTRDGYLWFATLDGLVRYDGAQMKVFRRSEEPGLGSNRILALHADREGSLWIGTEDGGIARLRDGQIEGFGAAEGVPGVFVTAFADDGAGCVWAATSGGLIRFQDGRWVAPPEATALPGEQLMAWSVGWSRPGGLRLLQGSGAFLSYALPPGTESLRLGAYRDPHAFWVRTGKESFLRLADGKTSPVRVALPEGGAELPRFAVAQGASAQWLLVQGRLLREANGRWQTFAQPVPAQVASPIALFEDREGSLWIGSETGLAQAFPTPLHVLRSDGNSFENSFYPVAESRDGRLWAGSRTTSFVVEGARFTRLDLGTVTAIQPEADGTVLLATVGTGVWRVRPDLRAEQVYATTDVMADLLRDRRGTLWMASGTGVVRLDGGGATRVPDLQMSVEVLLEGADGAIWAGGRAGLRRIGPNGVTSVDGLTSAKVRALYEDGRGSLWIGTYDGGLMRLRDGTLSRIRKRDGLFDDGVFAILDDGEGRLWMSSNRGIYSAALADLDAFADGRAPFVSSRWLGRAEGMDSAECNSGMQPAGFRRADGTLVFPTQKGLVVVDPQAFRLNTIAPQVVIEGIASEHRAFRPGPEVVLEPRESQLEVSFTAPTFVRAPQARFRYFMERLDDHWIEAGGARSARYAHLPPGRYRFWVTASNGDGVWNAEGTSFSVVVRPAWWETTWLRLGAVLAAVGAVGMGVRNRFARLARRRVEQDLFARRLIESQESERKRIAGELHDGVGQTLVMIRNRGLLSLREDADAARARRQAEQIVDAAGSGLDEIHKVIHNLRPYQLDRLGLTRALEGIVEKAAEASGLVFDAVIDPLDGIFSPEDDIHVYRVVQEAVSNVVRHAGASNVRVRIELGPQEVALAVEDDGRGFDAVALPPEKRGMGLSGIAERVRILGGKQTVESAPGRGTRVSVRLPRRGAAR